jgi:phage terminase large subunit-like protein
VPEWDKTLYDLIRDRRVSHDGNADLRQHIANANAKLEKDQDSKLRIVKKTQSRKIDLAVALSMACWECLRLLL